MYEFYYQSPIGLIQICSDEQYIFEINFVEAKLNDDMNTTTKNNDINKENIPMCITQCIEQLQEYFQGQREEFSVQIKLQGTDFQKSVWKALMHIPYGTTVSYKNIAEDIGNPKAVRAVGNANNKNKIPIIIPCHRVIGSNGNLVGYAGGLNTKEWLLEHEKNIKQRVHKIL